MALTLKKSRALKILMQTCMIMLIFCFAAHTAEPCRNYGHSCWGAHGKRSDIQDTPTMRILAAKTPINGSPQSGIAPSFKTQWIFSRLITGQPILPLTDRYRIRWCDFPKDRSYVPSKWNHVTTMTDEDVESIR